MSFLVVEWLGEGREYSVIQVSDITDGTIRAKSSNLVGKVVPVLWKGVEYQGTVLHQGDYFHFYLVLLILVFNWVLIDIYILIIFKLFKGMPFLFLQVGRGK